jgi:trehalose 6-phosphate synthase
MGELRRIVRKRNIFWWVDSFLKAAWAKDLSDFPLLEEHVPQRFIENNKEEQEQEEM